MILLHVCPSWDWHSREMSLHGVAYCGQNALSNPGGCLLAQCYTQRQCVAFHCICQQDLLLRGEGKRGWHPNNVFSYYLVGDYVWFKTLHNWCTIKFDRGGWPKWLVHNPSWWTERSAPASQCDFTGGRLWWHTF